MTTKRCLAVVAVASALVSAGSTSRLPASSAEHLLSDSALAAGAARETGSPLLTLVQDLEGRVFALTNDRRAAGRVPRMRHDRSLALAARTHSEDMLRRRFFSHVNPDRHGPSERLRRISGVSQPVGENIWSWSGRPRPSSASLAAQAVAAWMGSRPHRQNILGPRYRSLGVGAAVTASEVRLTQMFRE